ncbi:RIP metalloprotease RseP [Marvinbryantia formatexigens]|uniref:RIP metalloprotease RseP n=1 Tax=Marvinbryantia formatexigens TaxID=168384 RepID=UPI000308FEC0|nr:RIP metalloprotease RseP [Marvinbryantia formatexigens]UWO24147.1 RIP metalloprotease RseP [Marvinbryantia formatexigens DSM 14469]SDG70390.1 regulator of sigma E protease [Marvinbryantia formatexigens]
MNIVWALILFSLIILFHEFGHFLLAKKNGVTVVEFSLGMGPRILSREWHGTRYSWKLLPFGGSCMMLGEDEEESGEGSFGSKSVWARISIIAAGPVFNFILAFLLSLIIVGLYGYDPAVIRGVEEGSPAQEAGLQEGDIVTKMNGKRIYLAREVSNYISLHQGEDITLTYKHDGETNTVHIVPVQDEDGYYRMGVSVNVSYVKGNLLQVIKYSACEVRYWIDLSIESVRMLVTGKAGIKDMSGPVGVVSMIGETYTESAKVSMFAVVINMLNMGIFLSATLGVMNLLPLPALDGGRLVFLIIEAIRGKRVNPDKEAMVHFVGLMALMVLMVVVMYNDVARLL